MNHHELVSRNAGEERARRTFWLAGLIALFAMRIVNEQLGLFESFVALAIVSALVAVFVGAIAMEVAKTRRNFVFENESW